MALLRIATLNVWNKSGPWPERLALIRRGIQKLLPDVLGLQEVLRYAPANALPALTRANDQATEIAEELGFELCYGAASDYGNGLLFGNAVLSRHPIVETRNFALPGVESGEARALLYALVEAPAGRLPVFVTHLNWKFHHGSIRQRQVAAIAERVAELAPAGAGSLPPVLMGDFNAAPNADEIRFLTGLTAIAGKTVYFADAWLYAGSGPGYTFDRTNEFAAKAREPSRRIDYIFVRVPDAKMCGEPVRVELAFHEAGGSAESPIWPSDHFGVVADLAVTPGSA